MGDLIGARQSGRVRGAPRAAAGGCRPAGAGAAAGDRSHRRRPGPAAGGEPAAAGAGGGAVSEGGGAVSGGLSRPRCSEADPHTHAGRLPQAPHFRLERNVVRLRGVAGELPDEHRRRTDQRRLAAEQPAPRVPGRSGATSGRAARYSRFDVATRAVERAEVAVVEAAGSQGVELVVRPVVAPGRRGSSFRPRRRPAPICRT